jgi:PAS domain S-box-containing protein
MKNNATFLAVDEWIDKSSPFGLFTTDTRLRVTHWNGWMEERSGRSPVEVMGRPILSIYPDLNNRKMAHYFQEALDGRHAVISEALHGHLVPMTSGQNADAREPMAQSGRISPLASKKGIVGVIVYIVDVSERIQREKELLDELRGRREAVAALKKREQELLKKSKRLQELNTALNVMLEKRDEDRVQMEEKVLLNTRQLIEPLLKNLEDSGLEKHQSDFVDVLRTLLSEIISPFSQTLSTRFLNLTPSEIRVANLIKEGRTTKEVANLLNASPRAIAFHRQNLRKKLGLTDRRANLATYLLSFPK